MFGKEFLFHLVDEQGRSYYKENGLVKLSAVPKPLDYSPDGWQKLSIGWERNLTYFGVVRNFTLPLSFVYDGADIIKHVLTNGNVDTKLYLVVHQRSLVIEGGDYYFVYRFKYKGDIDLSTFAKSDVNDGYKVQVSIMEGGASKTLRAKEAITYEIPCNSISENTVPVLLDGIQYREKLNFSVATFDDNVTDGFAIPFPFLNSEGDSFGVYKGSQNFERTTNSITSIEIYAKTSDNYFFTSTKPIQINIDGTIEIQNVDVRNSIPHIFFVTSLFKVYDLYNTTTSNSNVLAPGVSATIDISSKIPGSIVLQANEKLFLIYRTYSQISGSGKTPHILFKASNVSISFETRPDPVLVYARRPIDVFKSLVAQISDGAYQAVSSVLEAKKSQVILSGNAIRGFGEAKIKTSIRDFFTAMHARHAVALSVTDDTIALEPKAQVFDDTNPIHLGTINKLKISLAKEWLYNRIKVGYPNQNYQTVNGREEFNSTQEYLLTLERITRELNLICPYRADGYGIQAYVTETKEKSTTDNKGDNELFIIEIEDNPRDDGYYRVKRELWDSITGINATSSAYNIGLSPKRMLLDHGSMLSAISFGFEQEKITYQTADKNSNLRTVKNGVVVHESADISVQDLPSPLFIPYILEFETKIPVDLIDLLNENPARAFSFDYKGITGIGFLLKASAEPYGKEAQQFTLLCSPKTDIKSLING